MSRAIWMNEFRKEFTVRTGVELPLECYLLQEADMLHSRGVDSSLAVRFVMEEHGFLDIGEPLCVD